MDYEYTILQKDRACLFNLPAMTSAKGHYLDTWKDMIWEGTVKVTAQNKNLKIYFMNQDKTIFAMTPMPPKYEEAIQKCVDSSRGFAVRLQHSTGKYAWVGLAFRDRNDAFDFNVCFSDFEKQLDRELNPQKYASEFTATKDFSLKPGEKISFNIAGESNEGTAKLKPKAANADFKIAPPPGSKSLVQNQQQAIKPASQNTKNNNDWGNFADFGTDTSKGFSGGSAQGVSSFSAFNEGWTQPASNSNSWGTGFSNQGFGAAIGGTTNFGATTNTQTQQGFSGSSSLQGFSDFNYNNDATRAAQALQQQPKKPIETNLIDLL